MAARLGFNVSLSSDIAPEPREFERASTTVANAFVAPVMARYLRRLETGLEAVGASNLRVMQSSGGALSADEAAAQAVKTALSGPAGGVVAAARIGALAGFARLMTFDMGGTSTDVALIQNGECPVVTTASLGGMPLRTPMLDIHTVGAGGGSLAWRDAAGGLRVGPQSAGADPGPVAYGRGEQLTVTDANLWLGRLPADVRLAGTMPLDRERVAAYMTDFATRLGCAEAQAALGIVQVANAAMTRALRHISVERGHDPADFTLLSFGGAGGLHACALAESLGMLAVLVPSFPGAFSALGLALADMRREYVRSLSITGAPDWTAPETEESFAAYFAALMDHAEREILREGVDVETLQTQLLMDLRYVGQGFDLRVPIHKDGLPATVAAFHAAHRQRYGHADPREPVEAVAVRVVAMAGGREFDLRANLPATPAVPVNETEVIFETGRQRTAVYLRPDLAEGQQIVGPALLLQSDATTLLPPGWQAVTDSFGNLILSR
jgi:N-methylhydantoinase A